MASLEVRARSKADEPTIRDRIYQALTQLDYRPTDSSSNTYYRPSVPHRFASLSVNDASSTVSITIRKPFLSASWLFVSWVYASYEIDPHGKEMTKWDVMYWDWETDVLLEAVATGRNRVDVTDDELRQHEPGTARRSLADRAKPFLVYLIAPMIVLQVALSLLHLQLPSGDLGGVIFAACIACWWLVARSIGHWRRR